MAIINIGTSVGTYEILSLLGKGGMGEVYRARDTKLKREVAIKTLPDEFSRNSERLARFQREAEALAALNHPNIGGIYHLQESNDAQYLVLELVEGDTLADTLAQRGALPVDEALNIARQICEALEAAHEKGIIHRDLKPANVKVTLEGRVKVLDFGLAKAFEQDASDANLSNSPTMISGTSMPGLILGTAAYMSPEQAKGRSVDKRSDVWAFGCLLYEMITGRRAFEGEDVSDTFAAVLRCEPDWAELPATLPPMLRTLIIRCVEKDRKNRIADISTALFLMNESALMSPPAAVPIVRRRSAWTGVIWVSLVAVIAGSLSSAVTWYSRPPAERSVVRLPFTLPEGQTFTQINRQAIAISPDGTAIVYAANGRLFVRSLSEPEPRPILEPDPQASAATPAFSPDGRYIAFVSGRNLKKVATSGGTPVTLGSVELAYGLTWDDTGILIGQGSNGILRMSPNGGRPETLVSVQTDEGAAMPEMLPDGQTVLFTLTGADGNKSQIVVQSLKRGERKILIESGGYAHYVATGHLVYALGGTLFAVPFDLRQLQVTGGPVPLVEGIRRAPNASPLAHFSISKNGSLIYIPGPASTAFAQMDLAVLDRKGGIEPLKLPGGEYQYPRVSPNGKRVAFDTDDGKETIVWIYDLAGTSAMRRLTFGGKNRYPVWSADGTRVAFQSDREGDLGIYWQAADGAGTAERLTKADEGTSHVPESWSPNGETLLFSVTKGAQVSLWTFSLKDKKATPFDAVVSKTPTNAVFSPDGRWMAYTSTERGTESIFVQPFPPTGAKYQILSKSTDNPHDPLWSRDGKQLFYVPRVGGFEVVTVTTQPTFAFGPPQAVPRAFNLAGNTTPRTFDISPDGNILAVVLPGSQTPSGTPVPMQIQVVLHWSEELKSRVPVK